MSERTGKAKQADHAGEKDRSLGRRFDRSRQEILIALVMLGVFVYLRVQIEELVRGRRGAAFLDPDFWPGWLLNILILLAIIYLVQSIMRALRPPPAELHAKPSAAATTEPAGAAGELAADADASADAAPLAPASQQQKEPEEEHLDDTAPSRNPLMLVVGFGLIFAFIWLMPRIGFIPSGLLFAVAFLLAVGERRLRIVATIPIVLMAVILYVFTRLLVVPLPRGRGFFLELSTYFY
jgi:putative tricarboxylic transport membrane protein